MRTSSAWAASACELLAPIGSLQFHSLGEVLRASQTLREIEAGIDIALSNVDDLPVKRYSALTNRVEGSLPAL